MRNSGSEVNSDMIVTVTNINMLLLKYVKFFKC